MNQTGVTSTGSRRQARRKRSFTELWYYAGWDNSCIRARMARFIDPSVVSPLNSGKVVSPILLRPIREQLEHDRVIRQLQTRWRRRFEVGINLGAEEETSVRSGDRTCYPDLVLTGTVGGRRLHGVVEVETAESVNHLEAMAEWSHYAKARSAFYLYVPAGFTDVALRLCEDSKINVTEIWAYYAIGSQAKFSMSYRSPGAKLRAKAAKKTMAAKKSKVAKSKATARKARKTTKGAAVKRVASKKAKTKSKSKAKRTAKAQVKGKTKTRAKTAAKRSGKTSRRKR